MRQAHGGFKTAPGRTVPRTGSGPPESVFSSVKNEEAPRRREANVSVYRSVVRKWGILDWSEDAWDPAVVHIRTGSVDRTNQRFKEEVPGTLVLDVSGVLAVHAVPSQSILFVEAWPSGNLSSKWVSWASGSWTFHAGVPTTGTHLLNLSADSKVGSGAGERHGQSADGNLAVHPVTSESLPARTLIGVASEPNGYVLIDEGSLLDPGGASLGNRDSNVVMEGQVAVPGGTVTFSVVKVSTMTTIVISPTVSLARAEEDTSMVFPGDSEIGLDLTTGVLRDGTWIFIFPVVRLEVETFHLGSNPDAFVLSSTGHLAWAQTSRHQRV